ncbi:hypothetical protein [Yersinia kristensenii]|uniref:hypothetical protein n=1 Tax=Yersinia kristensenii TaxID=28152 RepID=UPI0022FEADF5|nr:hypothetical protein [Yersinia kristensenii]MDA5490176.1 hypothetical protein [Yersinia kristensenii]
MAGHESLNPTNMPNCTGKVGDVGTKCNQEFTHQIKLIPVEKNKVPLSDIPWTIIFKDIKQNKNGKTDTLGKTERIHTKKPENVIGIVGKLAVAYQRRGENFGSLKEIKEREISLVTEVGKPKKEIPYCDGYDYITVVAARTAPRDMRWQGGYGLTEEGKGNQYRFINCGLRQLREFPTASRDDYAVQRIMVVFQQGYTENDIKIINSYTKKHNSYIVYVKNKSELINFINKRKEKKRLIKELVIFCHGIINVASYHYAGDNKEAGEFNISDIEKVYESIFDYDAEIVTYACRAGISVDSSDLTGVDAGQKQSPAQKMANSWDVKVKAFEMRSSYVGTYGTDKEIQVAKRYDETANRYNAAILQYQKEVAKGNKEIKMPEKPKDYEENIRRYEDIQAREINQQTGGPIAPNGAWCFPITGNTPTGLKKGLQPYQPMEWKNDKVK